MHVVIAGYGRVGLSLAKMLESAGHTVAAIDHDRESFDERGRHIEGRKLVGEAFDHETLVKAGIETADAFVAVTSGDNSNIVAARVAKERFEVPTVAARIFDPRRAALYQHFEIPTVCSVKWAATRLFTILEQPEMRLDALLNDGDALMITMEAPADFVGKHVSEVVAPGRIAIHAVTRSSDDKTHLLVDDYTIESGDALHFSVLGSAIEEFKRIAGLE